MKFGLTDVMVEKINHIFMHHPTIQKVIIYGSRAMGHYKPGSDIDLTVLGHNLTMQDLMQIHTDLDELLTPYTFDLSIYEDIDNPHLKTHIQKVGVDFYVKP